MKHLIDAPDAADLIVAAQKQVEPRKSICRDCLNFQTFSDEEVLCSKGELCCGDVRTTGTVSLAWAMCPELRWAYSMFDRVVVLTLKRRLDRYMEFKDRFSKIKWPFRQPEIFYGVDGSKLPIPAGDAEGRNKWVDGHGAWGCMLSHRQILQDAILDGVESILVLEDDANFVEDFDQRLPSFLNNLPPDWEGIMFGGQHMVKTVECVAGVARCLSTQRTHAYGFRGKLIPDMYSVWQSYFGHCDHIMGAMISNYKVFAPSPFLIGQQQSFSDITHKTEPDRCWSGSDPRAKLIYLEAPTALIPRLQEHGVHFGYNFKDFDLGIDAIFKMKDSITAKVVKLRNWGWAVSSEAAAIPEGVAAIWHPQATLDDLQLARLAFPNLIEASIRSLNDYLEIRRKYDLTARHNG